MRTLLLSSLLVCPALFAQKPADIPVPPPALAGDWIGVLEYRDYSEPPASTKRVQLPTWLTIKPSPEGLRFHYTYDDGPTKTVESLDTIVIDTAAQTYTVIDADHTSESYKVSGLDKLRDGRGELILLGTGKDNDKPAEFRVTLTIRRNLLSWLDEVRPAGSDAPFTFRHRYTFTRAQPPQPQPAPSPEPHFPIPLLSLSPA